MNSTKDDDLTIEVHTAEGFFESIYASAFPIVARSIQQYGGNLEDAKDVFHDALIIYYEKCMVGNFKIEKSSEAYVLGIAKHLWFRKSGDQFFGIDPEDAILLERPSEPTLNEHKLLKFLEIVGEKCLHLLNGFYYGHMNMKNIAAQLGYRSEHSATVQKYKCIEKIRKEIKQKSMTYEDFFE